MNSTTAEERTPLSPEPFRDSELPVQDRVDDLIARMTLTEKVGQLNQRPLGFRSWERVGGSFTTTTAFTDQLEQFGGLGAIYGLLRADAWSGQTWRTGARPEESAELAAMLQERVMAASRFAIPALVAEEAPHGHQALGGGLLPTNIGAAASWRPELLEEATAQVSAELAARGAHLALASGLDVLRDPRWGRAEECFGEDPLLASEFTRATVRGLQSAPGVGVVLKHFAGQGAPLGGRNGSGTPVGPRELAEIHLPAARAGIEEGAIGVMAAYNDLDGVPCIANEHLLTGILRDEWGFDGIVMADMGAVDRLTAGTESETAAGALALRAGVDLSLIDRAYTKLEQAVADGLIEVSLIDRACRRVLATKIKLGLLDPPRPTPEFPAPKSPDDLIAGSAVLLSNSGALPLSPESGGPSSIAVIGPNADNLPCLLGDYVPPLPEGVGSTVLAGLRDRYGSDRIRYELGSELTQPVDGGVERAAATARSCDVAVLVLGSSGIRSFSDQFADNGAAQLGDRPALATTGEGFDVAEVELPAAQQELVEAVIATGTPTIAVLISGRPLGLANLVAHCDAVLLGWYPGPDGGRVLAELIAGDREPIGRLPVSLPKTSSTLPVNYNERVETASRYVDAEIGPAASFGFGIGYADWQLGSPALATAQSTVERLAGVTLSATLINTSSRAGRQLVQLYGRPLVPGLLPRRAVLLGHADLELAAGAEKTITVSVSLDAIPGLGLPDGGTAVVDLWLSVTGAGEPKEPVRVAVATGP